MGIVERFEGNQTQANPAWSATILSLVHQPHLEPRQERVSSQAGQDLRSRLWWTVTVHLQRHYNL
jgi:hypothetical protein